MADILKDLYAIVEQRKAQGEEGSYTAYLFEKGLDKILKKIAEETGETIIAAKSLEAATERKDGFAGIEVLKDEFAGEIADLLYHLVVLQSALGVDVEKVESVLKERSGKTGNLKSQKIVDKNT